MDPSNTERMAQGKSLLLQLNKPVSFSPKICLHRCKLASRPAPSSDSSPAKGPPAQQRCPPILSQGLMPRRSPSAGRSWTDSCQSAGKDAVQCQERVPCTVPGALPGEAAAPALGCSCSPPLLPRSTPRGGCPLATGTHQTTQLSQATPHSRRLGLEQQILGFLLHFGFPKPSAYPGHRCVLSRDCCCHRRCCTPHTPGAMLRVLQGACLIHGGDHEY